MITQNNQTLPQEQELIDSLKEIVITKEPMHTGDIEYQALSMLRYLLTAHHSYLEEHYATNPTVKQEFEGFYFSIKEHLKTLSITHDLKAKYIKYLEVNQVEQSES